MKRIHLDFETYCDLDIKKTGHYRYCYDQSFDIMCFAYAIDDEPVVVVDLSCEEVPTELLEAMWGDHVIVAHNASFEMQCLRSHIGQLHFSFYLVDPNNFICTAAKSAFHALPRSLGDAASVLGVSEKDYVSQKDMLWFCKPQRGVRKRKSDNPEKWQRMLDYCKKDVEAERGIDHELPDLPEAEQRLWVLDEQINTRGIHVDAPLASKILEWNEDLKERLFDKCRQITGGLAPTQVAKIKAWCEERGYNKVAMDATNISEFLKENPDCDANLNKVLRIRQASSKSSTGKYERMIMAKHDGDRVRGCFMYHGATTGRWTGKLVQFQNMPRGISGFDAVQGAEDLHGIDSFEGVREYHKDPSGVFASVIRPCLMAPEGKTFHVADYTGIEARVLGWMAGEENYQSAFRSGLDLYKREAANTYQVAYEDVTKDQRQLGKVEVLGLGYGMGKQKFYETCHAWGVKVPQELTDKAHTAYRESNPNIVKMWANLNRCALETIKNGKPTFTNLCRFQMTDCGRWLQIILPSGRPIHYFNPRVHYKESEWGPRPEIRYDTTSTAGWVTAKTYGGKLAENVVQAASRDLLREALFAIDRRPEWDIVGHVHDEIIAETVDAKLSKFEDLMGAVPIWALNCIYGTDGWEGKRYRK